ncbi:MAG: CPBP family glutamic-type intramembrane protease [Cyanobacteria bacterium P01_F01_bin.42]
MPTLSSPSRKQNSLLEDYFQFLKRPDTVRSSGDSRAILAKIWRLYTVHLILITLIALVIQVLSTWIISISENKLGSILDSVTTAQFLFMAVVFAPLIEEVLFRLPLRFSRLNLGLPLVIVMFSLSSIAVGLIPVPLTGVSWLVLFALGTLLGAAVISRLDRKGGSRLFSQHLRGLTYVSAIVFGSVHIMNYPQSAWVVMPILVLPQTILGFLLVYVRIRFGFLWAVYTHALHNLLVSSPIVLMMFGSDQLRQKFFDREADVTLLPHDKILEGVFLVWMLLISAAVTVTVVRVLREWRANRLA